MAVMMRKCATYLTSPNTHPLCNCASILDGHGFKRFLESLKIVLIQGKYDRGCPLWLCRLYNVLPVHFIHFCCPTLPFIRSSAVCSGVEECTSGTVRLTRCFSVSMRSGTSVSNFLKSCKRVQSFQMTLSPLCPNIDAVLSVCIQLVIIQGLRLLDCVHLDFSWLFLFLLYSCDGVCDRLPLILLFSRRMGAAWYRWTMPSGISAPAPINTSYHRLFHYVR